MWRWRFYRILVGLGSNIFLEGAIYHQKEVEFYQTCKRQGVATEDNGRWFCRNWESAVQNRISPERFRIKKMLIVCFHLSLLFLFKSGSVSVSSQGFQVATINPQISSSPNYFLSEYNLLARIQNSVFMSFCKNQQTDYADYVSHLIQIHTWMRKRDVGTNHQKHKNNVLIAFQVISSNFPREKTGIQKTGIQKL